MPSVGDTRVLPDLQHPHRPLRPVGGEDLPAIHQTARGEHVEPDLGLGHRIAGGHRDQSPPPGGDQSEGLSNQVHRVPPAVAEPPNLAADERRRLVKLCVAFAPLGIALGVGAALLVDPPELGAASGWPAGGVVVAQPTPPVSPKLSMATPPAASPTPRDGGAARKAPRPTPRRTAPAVVPQRVEPTPTITPTPSSTPSPVPSGQTPGGGEDEHGQGNEGRGGGDPDGELRPGQGGGQGEQGDPAEGEGPRDSESTSSGPVSELVGVLADP